MIDRVVPYPGLRPFAEKDRAIFFGREAQTVSVLSLLEENRFVAVVGSSGSGKSSLILAGVIPAVREGFLRSTREWKIVVLKPGSDPCGNLARALQREGLGGEKSNPSIVAIAAAGSEADKLVEKLHTADRALIDLVTPPGASSVGILAQGEERGELAVSSAVTFTPVEELSVPRVLIVVDQFEELFTFRRVEVEAASSSARFAPRDEAATFVRLLLRACAEPAGRIAVVITMRSDFIGDCDAFLELPELVSQWQFLVPRLNRSQMREAIERPGEIGDLGYAPFSFEEGLVNRIIAEAGDRIDQLPLMQHALMRTWKEAGGPEAAPGSPLTLRHDQYVNAGKIAEALSKHADLAWAAIQDNPAKAHLTRQLFLLLSDVHPDGKIVRRRPLLAEVQAITGAEISAIEEIVRLFQSDDRNFLLPPLKEEEHLSEDDHLDISHEALLRQWTEFGKWLVQEAEWKIWLQELSQAAKDFENDPETELWHGNDLRGAEEWIKKAQPSEAWARRHGVKNWSKCLAFLELSRKESAELEARERESVRQLQEEKRQRKEEEEAAAIRVREEEERHQKTLLTLSRVIGVFFLIFAITMGYFWIKAQRNEKRARAAIDLFSTTADDVAVPITAYAASTLSAAEQQVAKLMAVLAKASTEPPPDQAATRELVRSRDEATRAAEAMEKLAASLEKAALDMTKEGDLKRKADLLTAEAHNVRQRRAALERNPAALIILKEIFKARLDRIEQDLAGLGGVEEPARAFVLSKDREIVAATAELDALLAVDNAIDALGFPRDDFADTRERAKPLWDALDRAAKIRETAANTSQIPLWKTDAAVRLRHDGNMNRVRFSPVPFGDASLIASAGEDKAVRFWATNGKALAAKTISSSINDIAFSPQGDALAVASNGSTVRVFRLSPGPFNTGPINETIFERHSDSITDVEFSHGGERIVSASGDRTVRVFDSHSMAQLYFTSPPLPGIVTSVAFHRGDNLVVSGCDDGGVRLHTIIEPRSIQVLGTFEAPARRPEFSSDGELIVAASGDKTARVWRTRDRAEVIRITHLAPVTHATFRPMSEPDLKSGAYTFVTTATNGEVRLIRCKSGATQAADYSGEIQERRHPGAALFATWSKDGHWLATVGGGEVILWEWTDEELVVRLRMTELHPATARAEFSPDARLLATYSGDQFAYLWDISNLTVP